jgi:hypothetical protein
MIHKLIAVSLTVLVAAFVFSLASDVDAQGAAQPPIAGVQPMKPHVGALPPLPLVSFEVPRPMPVIQQVYEFAARHPEVLQYVPCYCGCERVGHSANHSCFVKSRAANGRVTEWDTHGLGCTICIDVARDALAMYNRGLKPVAIRAAIDQKYGPHFPSSTPTPLPR